MNSPDYVHDDGSRLREQIAELRRSVEIAESEISHASSLHLDLAGPICAATDNVNDWASQIRDLERIMSVVQAGFAHFERPGFEDAIDACGEVANWTTLSYAPVPGTIAGQDDADIRLPIGVQSKYAGAVALHLFEQFHICTCFDAPADAQTPAGPTDHYLFGLLPTPFLLEPDALFLVARWSSS